MQTWHIHIKGRVQGLGFRPFVFRLAQLRNINGTVANTPNGVHLYISCAKSVCDELVLAIRSEAPEASHITEVVTHVAENQHFEDFKIVESDVHELPQLRITPDIAICSDCLEDIRNQSDRRYNYAFTTCTKCGPRYSIMQTLPYDRHTTTMGRFKMCPMCRKEYRDVYDRRFYSQTNSCPTCGVNLYWLTAEPKHDNPITHCIALLNEGKIVAVKGIGGFLLLADATKAGVVKRLRERKNRPQKPLAVLFKSINEIARYADVEPHQQKALESAEAPIVLLNLKKYTGNLAVKSIAPGLRKIGAMLPYAPILAQISMGFGKPLIATSGNVSGSPIIYQDDEAVRSLGAIADAILSHNRAITFPQDDSVLTFTANKLPIYLRRSRGIAPSIDFALHNMPQHTMAFGAEMKSAFAFTSLGEAYLSQYLGNTSTYESQESFNQVFSNLLSMIKPEIKNVLVDAHPNYYSAQMGRQWANKNKCEVTAVQHHRAHFAACLAEHDLIAQREPVLGIVWDGTGYGDDGNIWGGESFVYSRGIMCNGPKLSYYPHIGNNRMAKYPPLAALAALYPLDPGKVWMRRYFTDEETQLMPQLLEKATLQTSSVGRLFDAAAAVLEICTENTFEGEAAMRIQQLAEQSMETEWTPYCLPVEEKSLMPRDLLEHMLYEKKQGVTLPEIALRFHQTLVQWVAWVADTLQINKVAFSGGVFQNALLIDLIVERMRSNHTLYFHEKLPPNDENIAFGQLAISQIVVAETAEFANKPKSNLLCV